jgi:hypothetical protein
MTAKALVALTLLVVCQVLCYAVAQRSASGSPSLRESPAPAAAPATPAPVAR